MKSRAWLMVLIGAVVAACSGGSGSIGTEETGNGYQAGPGPQGGSALYSEFRSGPRLVLHQRKPIALTPADLRDRLATMETTPSTLDGVFLHLPTTGDLLTRGRRVSATAIAADLQPLYAVKPTQLRYNFAVVPVQRDLDAFDDWSVVVANFATLARVARDAGLVGIVIDCASRPGLRVRYPDDMKFPTRTIADYQAQTQLVGRKIMQAIVNEFPDAAVVVLRGPAGTDPISPVDRVDKESGTPELLGSFFAGFAEARVASALLVDGSSDNGRHAIERDSAAAWRSTGLSPAATRSASVGDTLVSTVE